MQNLLDSGAEIAGMAFTPHDDPEFFESPKVSFGNAIASLSPSANASIAGEVRVTFASATGTVSSGEQRRRRQGDRYERGARSQDSAL